MPHNYSPNFKLRSLFTLTLGLGFSLTAFAQALTPISISSAATVYNQNFDGLGATGTTYPTGWTGLRLTGTGTALEALNPVVSDGSSNTGAIYNVGSTAATDRAIGSLASASTEPAFGAVFSNQTGAAITRVNIAARTEQWRSGSNNAVNEIVAFEYSLNATSLSTGTWTAVTTLDLNERATTTTAAAAIDGNLAANSAAINGSITLNWPANTTMWIRWKDTDNLNSDALIAVDNFAISTGTTPLATRNAEKNSTVSVFPNPTTDALHIHTSGKGVKASVTVADLTGRELLSGTTAADGTFDVRSLPAGSYTITVNDGTESSVHKVVKR
ncbi:T9SS type A sorting domain-containing protein [Hymenobacter volaticus]|uniref:T9SS type A sorting domain-containing protein n=1 Tax=Hymenobacter volaticus TaxID=2932254 RepID=A0ABY4G8Z1_9BACT|nr:T9SS type A sorting domain-containing protein [Hymenobacter volaticus]UOQ67322.1 T9SS type A sorting domain-containing protein [Hymenobacter volaticus]